MKTIALFAALVPMGAAFGAWNVTGGDVSPAEPIVFAKAAGHSHHCRKPGVSEEVGENNLFAWAEKCASSRISSSRESSASTRA